MSTVNSRESSIASSIEGATALPLVRTMAVRMTTRRGPNQVAPLAGEEIQIADRALRRLHEQMRGFLRSLPGDVRNASALSRYLDVDRTTCQRFVFTASRPYEFALIDRVPGVRGMGQLIEAAAHVDPPVDRETLAALQSAIDRFDEAIHILAPSHSALLRRVAATPLAAPDGGLESAVPRAAREQLFEVSAEITGRFSETWVAVYVYLPGLNPDSVQVARVHGLIGHVARRNALPLTFHNFKSKHEDGVKGPFQNLCEPEDEQTPSSVIRKFSTDPLPVVNSRQPNEFLVQAIDTDPASAGRPVDLMLGTRVEMPHPGLRAPKIEEVWAMINFPVRNLVFDVYLHRDLARQCIPSLDAHLWRPDFAAQIEDRWQTRFADGPRLELLGQGMGNAATPVYERNPELTAFVFDALKQDDQRFIGYRCSVAYPMWRTGYCMSFDFNTSDDQ